MYRDISPTDFGAAISSSEVGKIGHYFHWMHANFRPEDDADDPFFLNDNTPGVDLRKWLVPLPTLLKAAGIERVNLKEVASSTDDIDQKALRRAFSGPIHRTYIPRIATRDDHTREALIETLRPFLPLAKVLDAFGVRVVPIQQRGSASRTEFSDLFKSLNALALNRDSRYDLVQVTSLLDTFSHDKSYQFKQVLEDIDVSRRIRTASIMLWLIGEQFRTFEACNKFAEEYNRPDLAIDLKDPRPYRLAYSAERIMDWLDLVGHVPKHKTLVSTMPEPKGWRDQNANKQRDISRVKSRLQRLLKSDKLNRLLQRSLNEVAFSRGAPVIAGQLHIDKSPESAEFVLRITSSRRAAPKENGAASTNAIKPEPAKTDKSPPTDRRQTNGANLSHAQHDAADQSELDPSPPMRLPDGEFYDTMRAIVTRAETDPNFELDAKTEQELLGFSSDGNDVVRAAVAITILKLSAELAGPTRVSGFTENQKAQLRRVGLLSREQS